MRLMRPLLAALFLALGALIGLLNRDPVAVHLGAVQLHSTLGMALIGSLLAGVLIGGAAVALGVPRRRPAGATEGRETSRPED